MRLLIAGWHGQIARALIEAAPSLPHVKALAAGRPALDVRDPRSIERAFSDLSPSVVINTAAYTAVDAAETDQESAFALNAEGARLLARAAARNNVPLIHVSTHYVFDGTKQGPYSESDEPRPATVYGHSKLKGESAVRELQPRHVIIRTGWVYSASGSNFATKVLESARKGEPLRVVADQRGNPTFAPHFANAILEVAHRLATGEAGGDAWGTYHAAGTGATSWHDFASELVSRSNSAGSVHPISSAEYPALAPRPANSELDSSKFQNVFGLRLPAWQIGVAECVEQALI